MGLSILPLLLLYYSSIVPLVLAVFASPSSKETHPRTGPSQHRGIAHRSLHIRDALRGKMVTIGVAARQVIRGILDSLSSTNNRRIAGG